MEGMYDREGRGNKWVERQKGKEGRKESMANFMPGTASIVIVFLTRCSHLRT